MGKMFKGPVMWFKNYYDENLSGTATFQDFLVDILTNPQEEGLANRIVNDFEFFNKSPEVFQNVDNPITYIIDLFTFKRENDENLYLKRKKGTPLGLDISSKEIHCYLSKIDSSQKVSIKGSRKIANTFKGFKDLEDWVIRHRKQKEIPLVVWKPQGFITKIVRCILSKLDSRFP